MPTNKLRFVRRHHPSRGIVFILQQEWDLGHGEYEWRDVPVEDEDVQRP